MMRILFLIFIPIASVVSVWGQNGPYAPPAGQQGTTAIHKDSSIISGWADYCTVTRGYMDISDTTKGYASAGSDVDGTGKPGENGVVSLGDGGTATLSFKGVVKNGPGYDFAVFENSFSDNFLELAFVEVSSDGVTFQRFPSVSLTDTNTQVGSFGAIDATEIYNFAGKYRANYGTPFDLQELTPIPGLNLDSITHIRIVDVVGSIDSTYARYDSQGNKVNDPWPTDFNSGGFDLDAIALINYKTTSVFQNPALNAEVSIYPVPASDNLTVNFENKAKGKIFIFDLTGKLIFKKEVPGTSNISLPVSQLNPGMYVLRYEGEDGDSSSSKFLVE